MKADPLMPSRSEPAGEAPLLDVANLRVRFPGRNGMVEAVRGVDFRLGRERLAIVGESGSGKSLTGRAVLGITSPAAQVSADRLRFRDIDLLGAAPETRRGLLGRHMGLILQDPRYSLNPVMTIGAQIAEVFTVHGGSSAREAWERALELLASVRIADPAGTARKYPHEISGGMGQRVMIAMMLAAEPDLLIADEPTSALDVSVQIQVLDLLDELVERRNMGLIFISHDLRLVSTFCDRVIVMYAGRVMEELPAGGLRGARHPYTRALIGAVPTLEEARSVLPVLDRDPAWLSGTPEGEPPM